MIIRCPTCGKVSEIEHVERGRNIECVCRNRFMLDDSTVVEDYSRVDASPPEQIGPYRIERLIGRGGMGMVFKGIHPTLKIPVAVKTLLSEYADNSEFKERFIKSAKICAKLNHPNIVRVYDFGTDSSSNNLYLVLEYIGGGSCLDMLNNEGHLSPEKVAEIALAVCNGLSEAEKFGIVHRDIKPDNILRSADGEFKLSDLGLAKLHKKDNNQKKDGDPARKSDSSQTVDFTALGTLQYMSPEQAIDSKNCDIRADIYSLGITMYQLISGQLPFDSPDSAELRRMQLEQEAVVPSEIIPSIPMDMEYIIMRCIRKDKAERYQSPAELKNDLEAFLSREELPSLTAGAISPEEPPRIRGARFFRRHGLAALLIIAVFLLCVTLISAILPHSQEKGVPASELHPGEAFSEPISLTPDANLSASGAVAAEDGSGATGNPTQKDGKTSEADLRRREYWEIAENTGISAIENSDNFDSAIRNFEAFLDNTEYSQKAKDFISRLQKVRESAIFAQMTRLDREAQPYVEKGNYIQAALVYETQPAKLGIETLSLRRAKAEAYRSLAEKELEKLNEKQLMKELARLVCNGYFKEACEVHRKKEGAKYAPDLITTLEKLELLPKTYADSMKKRLNQTLWLDFENGGVRQIILRKIESPEISGDQITGTGKNKISIPIHFTLSDLTINAQSGEIRSLADSETMAIWIGVKRFQADDLATATIWFKQAGALSPYLLEFNEEAMTEKNRQAMKDELLQILRENGAPLQSLPPPSELVIHPFFQQTETLKNTVLAEQLQKLKLRHERLKTNSPYDQALNHILNGLGYRKEEKKP